jgi:thioredoxin 1
MKKNLGVLTVFILIFVLFVFKPSPAENSETTNTPISFVSQPTAINDPISYTSVQEVKIGEYKIYSDSEFNNDIKEGTNILFFYASWCPTCRLLNRDIENNLKDIPQNTKIIRVPYDSVSGSTSMSSDLVKKYNVTYQHTLVQVNSNGDLIKKWVGSNNLNAIIKEIL